MLRVFIDETVLVEYIGERQPYCACWDKLNALQLTGEAEIWAAPEAYRVLCASLGEVLGAAVAEDALAATLSFVNVCSVDGRDVRAALHSPAGYDDALLGVCARKVGADYLVTRRPAALDVVGMCACTPEEMFRSLEQTRGLTFDLIDF